MQVLVRHALEFGLPFFGHSAQDLHAHKPASAAAAASVPEKRRSDVEERRALSAQKEMDKGGVGLS